MQTEEFSLKAQKLLDRLSGICRKEKPLDFTAIHEPSVSNLKTFYSTQPLSMAKSAESQKIVELVKLEQEML